MKWSTAVIFAVVLVVTAPFAQAADVTVTPVEAPLANLVQVVAPQARCAAVSDVAGVIAFGHRPAAADKPGTVSIFGIDAQGNVVGTPAPPPAAPADAAAAAAATAPPPLFTLDLPRPAALAAFVSGAQFILAHPKLPLLYVWQDIAGPPMTSAKANPVFPEFDHLLVYSLAAGQPPKLELATARGPGFMYGVDGAMLALDPAGKRLALPNLRSLASPDETSTSAVGYLALDERGLPVMEAGQPKLTAHDVPAYNGYPSGMGCVFVSDTVAVVGGMYGPMTWDSANPRARFNSIIIAGANPGRYRMIGHATLPWVYLSGLGTPYAFAMEHAGGYMTMRPQMLTLTGVTLTMPPVLLAKHNKVAFGGAGRVAAASLDAAGQFVAAGATGTVVNNPSVEALTYSEKLDRLYVAVEKAP